MNNKFDEFFSQAQMAFASGRYETVLELCEAALQLEPGAAAVYSLAGNACLVQNKLAEAERYFEQAVVLDSNTGERYFDLGNSLFGQQRLSAAMEKYAMAVQLGCRDEVMQKIYYLMGLVNQLDGKNKDALLNFDKSEKLPGANADQADILLKRIQIYVEQRDFRMAENCAVRLKLLVPSEFKSYQLLFQLYLEQKKIEEAEAVLKEAETHVSLDAETEVEIGFDRAMLSCFMAEQYPEQMDKYYAAALKQLETLDKNGSLSEKDKYEIVITSAEIYMKLQEYDKAEQLAQQAQQQTDPELIEYIERGRYILIECAEQKQDYASVSTYAQSLKKSDNLFYRHHGYYAEAFAVRKLAEKNLSLKAKSTELYNLAIAYYKNCTVSNPGDFIAYLYRAKSYVDIGKYDKASEIGKLLPADAQKTLQDYIHKVRKG